MSIPPPMVYIYIYPTYKHLGHLRPAKTAAEVTFLFTQFLLLANVLQLWATPALFLGEYSPLHPSKTAAELWATPALFLDSVIIVSRSTVHCLLIVNCTPLVAS